VDGAVAAGLKFLALVENSKSVRARALIRLAAVGGEPPSPKGRRARKCDALSAR